MKQNALSNILIVPEVISKEGIKYLLSEIEKSKKLDLAVFDANKSNQTGNVEWAVDKKLRDTQVVNISSECFDVIVELYRDTVKNIINPFYEFEVKDLRNNSKFILLGDYLVQTNSSLNGSYTEKIINKVQNNPKPETITTFSVMDFLEKGESYFYTHTNR
jgi:hypothetical protein